MNWRLSAILLPGLLLAQAEAPRPNLREFLGLGPAPDAAAAKLGESLYKENCSTCHGQTGRGAQGPNLVRSTLVLHDEKGNEIGPVIAKGRPQGGMPAFPDLTEVQRYQIAEYLHLQVELAANRGTYKETYSALRNQVTGKPNKGAEFFHQNCAGCHSVTKDLAHIGAKYPQPPSLLARITWPASNEPEPATVITPEGQKFSGLLMKLDDFDVALRDNDGTYRSWPRASVKIEQQDKLAGHRSLLPRYSDADLHNLTAYLASIK